MTIEEMRERKRELGYSYDQLSALSGVPKPTLQKVFSGTTASPRYDTIRALEKVLGRKDPEEGNTLQEGARQYSAILPPYDRQGTYTIYDREQIPDEYRTELIDGVLYDMASPASYHQLVAGEVYRQVSNFILENNGDCMPFIAPMDVQLDRDERTMVQPDVLIICDPDIVLERCIYGAPDFVLEVISKSTSRKDYTKKLAKYENAGVREYWIVDPYQRRVLVYFFEDETKCPAIFSIEDSIPVNIFEGKLEICLTRLLKWLPKEK